MLKINNGMKTLMTLENDGTIIIENEKLKEELEPNKSLEHIIDVRKISKIED